jgi:hypothetical protein
LRHYSLSLTDRPPGSFPRMLQDAVGAMEGEVGSEGSMRNTSCRTLFKMAVVVATTSWP